MTPFLKITRATKWQAIMAAALLLAANAPRAELGGRFFFTPQERAALDGQRSKSTGLGLGGDSITVNGLVTSSRGKSTVWINGAPQHESDAPRQTEAAKKKGAPGEIAIKLPDSTRVHPLKAGQTLTPGSGEIREGYQHRPQSAAAPGGPNSAKK